MILSMRRIVVMAGALQAFCACGGRADLSSEEDGSPTGSVDAAIDGADSADSMADSTVPPFTDGGGTDSRADVAPPPPQDASADALDASFPDGAICGAATCHFGCCDGFGQCVDPNTNAACGWYGAPCQPCGDGGSCFGGSCGYSLFTCGASNCSGCCIGNMSFGDAAQTGCFAGTDGEFCGHGGAGCSICGEGKQCRPLLFDAGGFCQANNGCDPTNCTGCCLGSVCAQGDQAIACGIGGVTCKNCGDAGACIDGDCACGGPEAPPCGDE
jgi:hypothetical protein